MRKELLGTSLTIEILFRLTPLSAAPPVSKQLSWIYYSLHFHRVLIGWQLIQENLLDPS